MTPDEARALARFVADHDKRYVASVGGDESDGGDDATVRLVSAEDGFEFPSVRSVDQYRAEHIEAPGTADPGPSVRAAFEAWSAGSAAP